MIIVFSDIHGCFKEFKKLNDYIEEIFIDNLKKYIFLGDYIDRGPYSREVVDKILSIENKICLLGNHEDMMLRYIKTGKSSWLHPNNGGIFTLKSFGSIEKILEYSGFFKNLKFLHSEKVFGINFLFSHANISRGFPVKEALKSVGGSYSSFLRKFQIDLKESNIWYRNVDPIDGYVLIHGHTPTFDGKVSFFKQNGKIVDINIDTGCVYGGNLTALLIPETNEERILLNNCLVALNDKFERFEIPIRLLEGDI